MSDNKLCYTVDDGVIALNGFIDRFTVPQLIKGIKLNKLNQEHLTIDMAGVEMVDTAGLAWILKVKAHADKSGQTVKLTTIPEQLSNLARLSGVDSLLSHK